MQSMKRGLFILLLIVLSPSLIQAQFSRYLIKLKDKNNSPYSVGNPAAFLSDRAIQRRARLSIPVDSYDLPVNPAYISQIAAIPGVTILNSSKWLNQVCVRISDPNAIAAIQLLSFVNSTSGIAPRPRGANPVSTEEDEPDEAFQNFSFGNQRPQQPADRFQYGQSYGQVHLHRTEFLHNLRFDGSGMRIAVIDGGFKNYDQLSTFDSVRNSGRILDTWDFVGSKPTVQEEHEHGMYCLSTIAANLPGSFVGTAPQAGFLLYRSEDVRSEYPVEEHFFAAAAERADSAGADLITVSLGYNRYDNSSFDYTYTQMNGRVSQIAQASVIASRKGILVCVAAGNDGSGSWHYITTPGDADSVITVGAVALNRVVANFSGYGPSADGRIKPDLAAVGQSAVIASYVNGQPGFGSGTSYATPILAGVTTCLIQAFPEAGPMKILDALKRSADRFTTPDDRSGYGIPDAKKAFVDLFKKAYRRQITGIDANCQLQTIISLKLGTGMRVVSELMGGTDPGYQPVDTFEVNSSFSQQNYSFSYDVATVAPPIDYKIRWRVDIGTDTSFYLDSVSIQHLADCRNERTRLVTIHPVPVQGAIQFYFQPQEQLQARIYLYDMSGKLVLYRNQGLLPRLERMPVSVAHLAHGYYVVRVDMKGEIVYSNRILIQ